MNKNFEYIEGPRACSEAIKYGIPITKLFVAKNISFKKNKNIAYICKQAKSLNINVEYADKIFLDKISFNKSHQGIIAKAKNYEYTSVSNILANCLNKEKSLIVILDHINDSGNLGAIIRSAEAFGADGLIIPNKRSAGVTASTYKTSAGAVCNMKISCVSNINNVINKLKGNNYWVVGATEHSKTNFWDINLKGKIAIVMGNENSGISSLVQKNCDFLGCLPLQGQIESLNVSQSFSACAYEWVRQNF